MRKLLKKQGFAPKLLVTDKQRSSSAGFQYNRADNSHQPVRTARAQDAALQVGSICPALPQHTRRRAQDAGEYARVAYFVLDRGTASPPPDGLVPPARV